MAIPSDITFSPDDRFITYLYSAEGDLVNQLYAFNPETGESRLLLDPRERGYTEENVTPEEALRRERQRQRALGVTQYAWAKNQNRLLIPLQGRVFVKDIPTFDQCDAPLREVVEAADAPALDPHFSPDGQWIAYVRDAELYVVPVEPADGERVRQLTHGARGTGRTHGLAEYIAQEEMGRGRGFWWLARGSQYLAFAEVDETHIPLYRIVHQGKDIVDEETHRYPFAGASNAKVRLGVVSVQGDETGGEPVWMDLGENEDVYLARVQWLPDGTLCAQLENRAQTELDLVCFDPATGERHTLLHEESDMWINLHDMFYPLDKAADANGVCENSGGFIWASERTGFRHLYLYDADGRLVRPLTQGAWMVDDIVAVDQARSLVYFTATRASPLERHLYVVPFSGDAIRQITQDPGMHQIVIDHNHQRFVDTYQALDHPPTVTLRDLETGEVLSVIYDECDPRVEALALQSPELVTLENRGGVTLYGAIYLPPARFGPGPYPTIVQVYGGPHAQLVTRGWTMTVAMRAQYLARQGFLVFVLDNRGASRRGLAFEGVIKHAMGHAEVADQVDGVRWLVDQGLADPDRVGIYGWSYGGYMALMALARAPEVFHVAVAGAPVTHWDGYDTHYTEHYMGMPQSNAQAYEASSVIPYVGEIRGKLLLVHGLIDENVHFRHTARLINALIRARKPYDLLLFPDERHMPRKFEDRVFMEEQICAYFKQNLLESSLGK
jgi:dipeptidyl-peptidase-4